MSVSYVKCILYAQTSMELVQYKRKYDIKLLENPQRECSMFIHSKCEIFMFIHKVSNAYCCGAQIEIYTLHVPWTIYVECRCRQLLWCTIPPFLKPFIKLYCGLVNVSMWLNRKFIFASVWYQNFNCFSSPFHEHFWCSSFFYSYCHSCFSPFNLPAW